jgi:hypothetical protein
MDLARGARDKERTSSQGDFWLLVYGKKPLLKYRDYVKIHFETCRNNLQNKLLRSCFMLF